MKKDMLDKVKMPAREDEENPMLELEDADLDMEEGMDEEPSLLADMSDEELLAEVRARGLKLDAEDEAADMEEEDELALMDFEDEEEEA